MESRASLQGERGGKARLALQDCLHYKVCIMCCMFEVERNFGSCGQEQTNNTADPTTLRLEVWAGSKEEDRPVAQPATVRTRIQMIHRKGAFSVTFSAKTVNT